MENSPQTPNSNPHPNPASSNRRPQRRGRGNRPFIAGQRPPRPQGDKPSTPATAGAARPAHAGRRGAPRTGEGNAGNRGRRNNNRSQQRRRPDKAPALTHRLNVSDQRSTFIPEVTHEDVVRIIPVSGVEEIGRNMNIIETKDDIIVIDAGFMFVSEETGTPGVDYILPNTFDSEAEKPARSALVESQSNARFLLRPIFSQLCRSSTTTFPSSWISLMSPVITTLPYWRDRSFVD